MKSRPQIKSISQIKYSVSALIGLAAVGFVAGAAASAVKVDPALHDQALGILQKSISFRTVEGAGQVPAYAEYLKSVLVDAGFAPGDITIEPVANTATLVAHYRGTDSKKKPLLVIGHMDVVEAKREDWKRDPFTPVVENGYVFGRGSVDNKFELSMITAVVAKLKREGWKPKRDVILAFSGDEETQMASTRKLASQFKNAELALNGDAGGGLLAEDGKPVVYGLQAGEKSYADFKLTVTNPGGHSSRPGKTNAINQLAQALDRIAAYEFPAMHNELTLAYFKESLPKLSGSTAAAIKSYLANPQDAAGDCDLVGRSELRWPVAHDVRGHADRRRSRTERATAEGGRQYQLPHLPWRESSGRAQDVGGSGGRSGGGGDRAGFRLGGQRCIAIATGCDEGRHQGCACALSGPFDRAFDVSGRHRQHALQGAGRAELRRVRLVHEGLG